MLFQQRLQALSSHHLLTRLGILAMFGFMVLLTACGGSSGGTGGTTGSTCPSTKYLTGAGSTFDYPLFSKMFSVYPNAKCGANVNYQPVGSGAGINDLLNNIVAFGATDTPLTDAQIAKSTHGSILHIPVTLGAEAIVYNLQGIPTGTLKLTGPIVANIYLGKITSWDDPTIKQINSGVTLPHLNISVVHRSDGSGTTGIFTHYLSAVSSPWQSQVGAGTTVKWPTGVGGKGNAGVAAAVNATAGALGYLELAYVVSNNILYTLIQNKDGQYVAPSLNGAKADAANVTVIPPDLRFFIVNAVGADSYPISGFSWVVIYQNQTNADRGKTVANMLWWMIHDGQHYATALTYVPLPAPIVTRSEAQIKAIQCGSSTCYTG